MWWGFALVLGKPDWFEAFGVNMETKLPPERKESIDIVWYPVSFLDSSCLLPGINYLPSVVPT